MANLSIIVPFFNESLCAQSVLEELKRVRQPTDEIIAVNDGSTDDTATILEKIPDIKVVHLGKNLGQSAAIVAGMQHASGAIIATMDGDGQNDPLDFDGLLETLKQADFVIGFREHRKDSWSKRIASRIANGLRRRLLRDHVRDSGCGLKAFRREVMTAFIPFNGLHRFMPALAINAGHRVAECAVNHRPRQNGISKYTNWERGLRGCVDVMGVSWFLRRSVYPTVSMTRTHAHE